jgi:hypothetical protein
MVNVYMLLAGLSRHGNVSLMLEYGTFIKLRSRYGKSIPGKCIPRHGKCLHNMQTTSLNKVTVYSWAMY